MLATQVLSLFSYINKPIAVVKYLHTSKKDLVLYTTTKYPKKMLIYSYLLKMTIDIKKALPKIGNTK